MNAKQRRLRGWIVVVLAVTMGVIVNHAINICIEYGLRGNPWTCLQPGSLVTPGAISSTNLVLCAGNQIIPPTLTVSPTFTNGVKTRWVMTSCSPSMNHTETAPVRYTAGPLYFEPAIPFSLSPGTYVFTAKVNGVPSTLGGWWPGQNNTTDVVFNNNGTLKNGATYGAGKVGQAFSFNGTDAYVEIPSNPNNSLAAQFTVETWINYTGMTGSNGICVAAKGEDQEAPMDWSFNVSPGQKLRPQMMLRGITYTFNGSTTLVPGTWYHVAMVYDGNNLRSYVNGVQDGGLAVGAMVVVSQGPMRIGANAPVNGTSNKCFFYGLIDELSLHHCALSAAQLQAIYNAGSAGKCWTGSPAGCSVLPAGCVCSSIVSTVGVFSVTVTSSPPVITSQPANQAVVAGNTATFSVGVSSCPPNFAYEWYFNGTNLFLPIPTIVRSNAQAADAGDYFVVLYNPSGAVTSSVATLTLIQPGTDDDYDGVCSGQEVYDGTDPVNPESVLPVQLGSWRFDTTNWIGLQGQLPLTFTNLASVAGMISNAVRLSTNLPAWLTYRDNETNSCFANINVRKGSIRFWFKSDWNSVGTNNGVGPQSEARLIEMGTKGSSDGWWALTLNPQGTNISFYTQTNSAATLTTNLTSNIRWTSNEWHQIVLTFGTNKTALYIDGQPAMTNGAPMTYWPGAAARALGFRVGSDAAGTNQAKGRFENLETYNYILTPQNVSSNYSSPCLGALDVMLVIDRSGSMAGQKFNDARQAGSNFVNNLNFPFDQVGIEAFDDIPAVIYRVLTNSKLSALQGIQSIPAPGNSTFISNAIWTAQIELTSVRHNPGAVPVMVLLTDGQPMDAGSGNPVGSSNLVVGAALQAKNAGTRLITIGLGTGADMNLMQKVASTTNDAYFAPDSTQLNAIYNSIASSLCRGTNLPPTVQIVSPTNLQVFNQTAGIPITALATDPENGLVKVEFFAAGTNKLGEDFYGTGNLFNITWNNPPAGTNRLTAVAWDEFGLSSTSSNIFVIVNQAPVVDAGPDKLITLPVTSVMLSGTVSDDGFPPGASVSRSWSVVSSNGPVSFDNVTLTNATVTFVNGGLYTLRLTAHDGISTNSDTMRVQVNRAPVVSAGGSQIVTMYGSSAYAFMNGTVTDDGLPLGAPVTKYWSVVSATNGGVAFIGGTNILTPTVLFANNGGYILRLTADDTVSTNSSDAMIIVNRRPTVFATNQTLIWYEGFTNITTTLKGSVTDDGYPFGTLQVTWDVFSGPTTNFVAVNNPHTLNATVSFPTNAFYVMRLTATDGAAERRVSCLINIRRAPFVAITAPTNNQVTCWPVGLKAYAFDRDGTVTNVQFFNGTNLLGTGTVSSTNYVLTWSNAPVGTNTLTAIVKDNEGLSSTSAPVKVIITGPCSTMTVGIVQPAANATFVAPAVIPISANVTNGVNVQRVEFYAGSNKIGQDAISSGNPYTFTWVGVPAGDYVLTAKAFDAAGGQATSAGVPIRVVNPVKVSPGPDRVVILTNNSATIVMNGSYTGGFGTVTSLWAQATGPTNALIQSPTSFNSGVVFTNRTGTYQFRLTAGDNYTSDSAIMSVVVLTNQPPVVDPGPNRIISPGQIAFLNGSVKDDGLPLPPFLSNWWTVAEQPAGANIGVTNRNLAVTFATNFIIRGVYRLQLNATDGLATSSNSMTVTVADPSSRTYTYSADFAEGELVNVNFDEIPHQLQLNQTITPFPYVWVACSARGTIVKIDANTGQILGEYRTAPKTIGGPDPSRTTVDRYGNAWVCNRGDDNIPGTSINRGTITRVGLIIGGTRGWIQTNAVGVVTNFIPDQAGEYLQPPFKYSTAVDRNRDGYIRTSRGLGNPLDWDLALTHTNDAGGVSEAEDECIINYTRVSGTGARTIAIDAKNDLWVGGLNNLLHEKVDGITGLPIPGTVFYPGLGGYGGLIDGNGTLWSSQLGGMFRFDIARRFSGTTVVDPTYVGDSGFASNYGIGIDPRTGHIWFTDFSGGGGSIDPVTLEVTYYDFKGTGTRGIVVDDSGNVWVANSFSTTVTHFRTDGTLVGLIDLGCNDNYGPTGVSIDSNGKIWATCLNSHTVVRIDPKRGPRMLNDTLNAFGYILGQPDLTVSLNAPGQQSASPYNYSDMTGYISLGATEPLGIWRVVHDSGITNQAWGVLRWTSDEPPGTKIKVEIRAATSESLLSSPTNLFREVLNQVPFTNSVGRYIEIRAQFTHKPGTNATPVLYDLTVSSGTNAVIAQTANFATDDRAAMFENSGSITIPVLTNDITPPGATLTITKVSPPASGYVKIAGGSTTLIYTPNSNFFGADRFTYTAVDGQGGLGRAVVTVAVGRAIVIPPTNYTRPTAVDDTNIVINGNSPERVIDVLANDFDTNDPLLPLALKSVTQPDHGFVRITGCDIVYTPNLGYFGPDEFTYAIQNSQGLTDVATVKLRVVGTTGTIACGGVINGSLKATNSAISLLYYYPAYYTHTYRFAGDPSKNFQVSLNDSGYGAYVRLFDPAGNLVGSASYQNPLNYVPRDTNTYTAEVVYGFGGLPDAGISYTLSLTCSTISVPHIALLFGTNALPSGSAIDFGVTRVGTPVLAKLTITNYGTATLNVQSAYFDQTGAFTLTNTALVSQSITIAGGGSSNLNVRFDAYQPGETNGLLTINSSDASLQYYLVNLKARANATNTILPKVGITNPLPNTIFTASQVSSISITATAAPASGALIWGVNFYAQTTNNGDNFAIGQVIGQYSEYTINWTTPPPGDYQLTAVAIDDAGLQKVSTPVPIKVVRRPANSPELRVLFTTNNLPNDSTINFGVAPPRTAVPVSLVISNAGSGTLTATLGSPPANYYFTNSPTDEFSLAPATKTNVTLVFKTDLYGTFPGTFVIYSDDVGLYGPYNNYQGVGELRLKVTGTATNTCSNPTVAIANVSSGATFIAPTNIILQATATANSGAQMSHVDFYAATAVDNFKVGTAYDVGGGLFEMTWYDAPIGNYTLTAVAVDNAGLITVSSGVSMSVLLRPATSPILQLLLGPTNIASGSTLNHGLRAFNSATTTTLTLSNRGNASLSISSMTFSGTGFSLVSSPTVAFSIPANGKTNITVRYAASPVGESTAVLMITNNDAAFQPFYLTNFGRANPAGSTPSVTLTNPPASTTVTAYDLYSSGVTLTATATPPAGGNIHHVDFYLTSATGDLLPLGTHNSVSGNAYYLYNWYDPDLTPGVYTLTAIAVANSNSGPSTVSAAVPVTVVLRSTSSPEMRVRSGTTTLTNNNTINFGIVPLNTTAQTTLSISNAGPGAMVISGTYINYNNDKYWLTNNPEPAYTLAAGTKTNITLVFRSGSFGTFESYLVIQGDDEGLFGPYNPGASFGGMLFKVTATTPSSCDPPTIAITNPAPNAMFVVPITIPLQAVVTVNGGASIQSVSFYASFTNGNVFLGNGGDTGGGSYLYNWFAPLGDYNITAVAVDSIGRVAVSTPVHLSVLLRPTNSPIMRVFLQQSNQVSVIPNRSTLDWMLYGIIPVGTPITAPMFITNSGNAALSITKITLSNTNAFSIQNSLELPLTIPIASSTNLILRFNANVPGEQQCVMTIYNNDVASHPFTLSNVARANPVNGAAPTVQLTGPADGSVFTFPGDVSVSATATTASNALLQAINFFTTSPTGAVQIGQFLAGPNQTNASPTITWSHPAPGTYQLKAIAIDRSGLMGESTNRVVIQVKDPSSGSTNPPPANAPPVANDDVLDITLCTGGCPTYTIEVLNNDTDVNYDPLVVTSFDYTGPLGRVTQQGNNLLFTPNANQYGSGFIHYTITDGRGGDAEAWVELNVSLIPVPEVSIVSPEENAFIELSTNVSARVLPITAEALATNPGGSIVQVSYYDGDQLIGSTNSGTGNLFTFLWKQPAAGGHSLSAIARDNAGQESSSQSVSVFIVGKPNNNKPIAAITNLAPTIFEPNGLNTLVYPIITNGVIDVRGIAKDIDPGDVVRYQLLIYRLDGTLVANITPSPDPDGFRAGPDNNGILGTNVNLSLIENGMYDLVLNVFDGWEYSEASARILLDSQLKIGNFSFSITDLTIPVGGFPLAVVRTYNSLNLRNGDFGFSWTYDLIDMDLQIDEVRRRTEELSSFGSFFSLRVGGGRNVTLTLPEGRRVTFQFYFEPGGGFDYTPRWQAPPGVDYELTAMDNPVFNGLNNFWNNSAGIGFEAFDFSGFELKAPDGTRYIIPRKDLHEHFYGSEGHSGGDDDDGGFGSLSGGGDVEDFFTHAYGEATLSEIIQPDGNRITVSRYQIDHYNPTNGLTRSIRFERDGQGRIIAIRDPNSGENGVPALKYAYDENTGNLVNVMKLSDRNANGGLGAYDVTTYQYTNTHFPHFLTDIFDPRGIPIARNYYDDNGKLIATEDANGGLTRFIHNVDSRSELVVDQAGRTNSFLFDLRGNVVAYTNAAGQIITANYDGGDNKTNEVLFRNGQPYVTNRFVYNENHQLLSTIDPLGHSNTVTYGAHGRPEMNTDALGNSITNFYDGADRPIGTASSFGNSSTNFYDSAGRMIGSRNALGTMATNYYNDVGRMIANAAYVLNGGVPVILETNSFDYDANNNRISSTSWRKVNGVWTPAITTFIYDAQDRVVKVIDPDGGTNTSVFNSIGKQEATIDKAGRVTSFTYDRAGRVSKVTYPDLTTDAYKYDAVGNRTNSTDRAGKVTTFSYDAMNRLTQTTYPDQTTSRTVYDELGRAQFGIDARGLTNAFGYDLAGRRVSVTNALGTSIQQIFLSTYDANGNPITFTDALGRVTTNVFDSMNRQVRVQYPDGTKASVGYDVGGQRAAETNQENVVTFYGYDGVGRLAAVTNAAGKSEQMITRYAYDEVGNLLYQVDTLGRTNAFAYDNMKRRTRHSLPGNQTEYSVYDAVGNLAYQTNFNGTVIASRYDSVNHLTNRSSAGGYNVSCVYSPMGRRLSMADPSGTTTFAYDNRDRLLLKTVAWLNGPTVSLNYRYDANGNLTNLWSSTANGVKMDYSYDLLNRLTNVLANDAASANYSFDAVGNLQSVRYGNGVTNLYQYDGLSRLTNSVWKLNASTLASFYYQLGQSGHRTNLNETLNGTTRNYAWNYDALYRLKQETLSGGSSGTVSYGYDTAGNRTNRNSSVGGINNQTFTYNTNDWLSSDGYDNNGNTTNSSGNVYQYDALNHVTNVNNGAILMTYDGDGNRVSKTVAGVTTYYLVDSQNPSGFTQVLEEYQGSTLTTVYNYGFDLVSQRQVSGGVVSYYGYDGLGSTRFLANTSGAVSDTYVYDAYGTLITSSGTTANNYRYAGEQYDSDLGFYYLRARYLNPVTGRFQTMDTFQGDQQDPLSLHKYLYARDNPMNFTDPSGNESLGSMMVSMGIQATLGSIVSSVIGPIVQKFTAWLVPDSVWNTILDHVFPDAILGGVSGFLTGGHKAVPIGLTGGGGVDLLFSPKTRNFAVYTYWGGGATVGSPSSSKGISLAISGYLGVVWNTPSSKSYEGPFLTLSFPYSAMPKEVQQKVQTEFLRMSVQVVAILPGGWEVPLQEIEMFQFTRIVEQAPAVSTILDKLTFNVFWDYENYPRGSCGISAAGTLFEKTWGSTEGKASITWTTFTQRYPRKANGDPKFVDF